MSYSKSLLALVFISPHCLGGNLNIVHLAPTNELKLEIKAGGLNQEFSLSPQGITGVFALPQKPAVLRTIGDETPSLKISAKVIGQIAVLHAAGESFKWSIYDSKPTGGKTTLRLINLTEEDVIVLQGVTKISLKSKTELPVEKVTKAPIRLSFENGEKVKPYEQEEPSAVIGFVYKSGAAWSIFYVNDT